MSVKISGVMKDAMGKPIPDCIIELKALHTTATVITKTVGSQQPDENGSYSMDVEQGKYSVTLCVEGYPPNRVGEIYIHSESVPGTLNYYLGLPTEGDLPPAAIQRFEEMVALVAKQAAQVEKDKAAAAQSAVDALASKKAAKTSETNANNSASDAAASAQASKASETNADNSKKAAQASAADALASQNAAKTSEIAANGSKVAAAQSAADALASKNAAKVSETNAGKSADAAAASEKAAKLSETNAKTSENNAGESAAAALVSEKAAKTSETNTAKGIEAAAASAQAAKLSETNADGSKKAAQTSAAEALASQGAAKTSETNAGNSAKAASGSADKAKSEADRATAATDGKQDENALLTAIAALNTAADQIITLTGKNSVATAVLTKFAKEMLAKTDADGVREYLGLREALIRGNFGLGNYTPILADADTLTSQNGFHGGGGVNGVNFFDPYAPMIHVSRGNQSFQIQSGVGTSRLAVRGSSDGGKSWSVWTESVARGDFGLGGFGVDTPWSTAVMGSFRSSNIDGPTVSTVYMGINMPHGSDSKYCAQLMARGNLGLWYRCRENGVMLPYLRVYDTGNTSVDSNGFIKKASPIIKIFHDGSFETNDESSGASVERESVGVYRISGVLGMNSDGAWGGIDGGFDVPKDRNGQHLVWLDYEVDADGSILVKTYHRTYPDAPAFARNIKEGYEEGDLIDIPSDQFVSVRVEMPQDSIWNLAQKGAQEEMEQEKTTEE